MNLRKYWDKLYISDRWTIGFIEESAESLVERKECHPYIHWIENNYKDRFFADPFILNIDKDGVITVLVEELIYTKAIGSIVELKISPQYKIISRKNILSLRTHLSYPFIVKRDNGIFVYPENCENNSFSEYQYINGKLFFVREILNLPLCDSTFLFSFNSYNWLFTTFKGKTQDSELLVYFSHEDGKKYISHPANPVVNNAKTARPGGNFIFLGTGKIVRVAQDCYSSYGGGLSFMEIKKISPTEYKEVLLFNIYPDENGECPNGLHTFNGYQDIVVVDGIRKRKFCPLKKVVFVIRNILRRKFKL